MARFYLHQRTATGRIEDPEGSDLPDLDAARSHALTAARHLWAAAILQQGEPAGLSFEIADEQGQRLASISFRTALPKSLQEM
jgi:hypothetical protein